MKIIELRAENIKKIRVVDITPADAVVTVTGKNGSGKSSLLDSIFWLLGGKEGIQDVPIRRGAEKGRIFANLGDLVVERKFSASGNTSLTVRVADDQPPLPSPQAILDKLIGRLAFDPLEFSRKPAREQYAELKNIAKVEVDLAALEKASKADYELRTERNAEHKRLVARAQGYTFTLPPVKEKINVSDLMGQFQSAARANADIEVQMQKRAETVVNATEAKAELSQAETYRSHDVAELGRELDEQIAKLRLEYAAKLSKVDGEIAAKRKHVEVLEESIATAPKLPQKKDVEALSKRIEEAGIINREFDRRVEQADILRQAKAAETQTQQLTQAIEDREEVKRNALEKAQMPVEGMSLGDGIVLMNGLPFDQCSDAEQLRVSVAIAMAANPDLRVIRIRSGDVLDDDGLELLRKMAEDKDFQVWLESVHTSDPMAVVMEDGRVAVKEQEPEVGEAAKPASLF